MKIAHRFFPRASLRPSSGLRNADAAQELPQDGVSLSRDRGSPQALPKALLSQFAKLALACCLSAGLGCIPGMAQTPVQVTAQQSGAADGEISKALREMNKAEGVRRPCVEFDRTCQQLHGQLPAAAQQEYAQMPGNVKTMLASKLQGKTTVIPLILKIDHRESFVRGKALGHDTFDFVEGRIEKQVAQGSLSAAAGERSKRFLEVSRGLTPDQRGQLVDLIVRDARLARETGR